MVKKKMKKEVIFLWTNPGKLYITLAKRNSSRRQIAACRIRENKLWNA
jgi:hypothetical protein